MIAFGLLSIGRRIGIPNHEFYAEMTTGQFVCLLKCRRCHAVCAVSGNYSVDVDHSDGSSFEHGRPQAVTPPPPMIAIPNACPAPVKAEVQAAFSLYWLDPAACLNRIRNALELVLDDLKVPKSTRSNGKKHRLNLHQRIERLEKSRPRLTEICERMMAVKHLGNAGSSPWGEGRGERRVRRLRHFGAGAGGYVLRASRRARQGGQADQPAEGAKEAEVVASEGPTPAALRGSVRRARGSATGGETPHPLTPSRPTLRFNYSPSQRRVEGHSAWQRPNR